MANNEKIFLNDIPLDIFLEYFSAETLSKVNNTPIQIELLHYIKRTFNCKLVDANGTVISEKIYESPNGKTPSLSLLYNRIFKDELFITGIDGVRFLEDSITLNNGIVNVGTTHKIIISENTPVNSTNGFPVYRTLYSQKEKKNIRSYHNAFMVKELTNEDGILKSNVEDYPDSIFRKYVNIKIKDVDSEDGWRVINSSELEKIYNLNNTEFKDIVDIGIEILNQTSYSTDDTSISIKKRYTKEFSEEFSEYDLKIVDSSNKTTFFNLVFNQSEMIDMTDSSGKKLYKSRNGVITTKPSYNSIVERHNESIRKSFHKFGDDSVFLKNIKPGQLFITRKGENDIFTYYNELEIRRSLKPISTKDNVAEKDFFIYDGEIYQKLGESNKRINKDTIDVENLKYIDMETRVEDTIIKDRIMLNSINAIPEYKGYRVGTSSVYIPDLEKSSKDFNKICIVNIYQRYVKVNSLNIPISGKGNIYMSASVNDDYDSDFTIAESVSTARDGEIILVQAKIFDTDTRPYIAVALRRGQSLINSSSGAVETFENLEDFDGKFLHIYIGKSQFDQKAQRIVGQIVYNNIERGVRFSEKLIPFRNFVGIQSEFDIMIPIYLDSYYEIPETDLNNNPVKLIGKPNRLDGGL